MLWANNHILTLLVKQTDTSKYQLSLRGYTWLCCLQFSQVRLYITDARIQRKKLCLVDTSHSLVHCTAKEHENCDIVFNERPFHLYILYLQPIGACEEHFEVSMPICIFKAKVCSVCSYYGKSNQAIKLQRCMRLPGSNFQGLEKKKRLAVFFSFSGVLGNRHWVASKSIYFQKREFFWITFSVSRCNVACKFQAIVLFLY